MRNALILVCSAGFLVASDSVARPDSGARLTPKAAAALKQARQHGGAVHFPSAVAGVQQQGSESGVPQRTTRVVVRPDGSLRAYLGDDHMTDMVAVKGTDGKVAATCAHDGGQHLHEHAVPAEVK